VFREGALVTALREGHWLVLDELNLAPTEVLEALNRWDRAMVREAGGG
jgi:midasin